MEPVSTILELLRQALNDVLRRSGGRADDVVVLSNIVDHQGREIEIAKGRIAMVLTSIVHEETVRALARATDVAPAPFYVDLFVLFYANYQAEHYADGVKLISRLLGFLQQNPIFTRDKLPGLDASIDRLVLEYVNLRFEELDQVMHMLGVSYLPSVCYRLRMIPIVGEA